MLRSLPWCRMMPKIPALLRYGHDVTQRGAEWGEEAAFAVVSREEYVSHAARQLWVPGNGKVPALERFAKMRHVMKTTHKLVFLNGFSPHRQT